MIRKFATYVPVSAVLLFDANILIAHSDPEHEFHPAVKDRLDELFRFGCSFFYTDYCLREFREYFRRKYLKAYLLRYIKGHSVDGSVVRLVRDLENSDEIYDGDLKRIRRRIIEKHSSGMPMWQSICRDALKDKFERLEQSMRLLFTHAVFDSDSENAPTLDTELEYTNSFGIGINDAALLDFYLRSVGVDALVTNDTDILQAFKALKIEGRTLLTTLKGY
jgi:predicted nucleic acid-binding protein